MARRSGNGAAAGQEQLPVQPVEKPIMSRRPPAGRRTTGSRDPDAPEQFMNSRLKSVTPPMVRKKTFDY
jgi:hypothetical protein